MRFGPSSDQLALRDAVRALLRDRCTSADVRRAWHEGGAGYDAATWSGLAEMGVLGLLAPEAAGGAGLGTVELVLACEEAGSVALPGPLVEHAAVAVPALAEAGAEAGADVLSAAAAGSLLVATAPAGERVEGAAAADVLLLVRDGVAHLVDPATATLTPERSVDGARRGARVCWEGGQPLPSVDVGAMTDRGAVATAAQLVGLAAAMVRRTVAYVSQRKQFGVPVGSFQAVKHQLADAHLRVEYARPVVLRAAYALDAGEVTRSRDCSAAKVAAGRGAELAGRVALQCHGAIGYTAEHDLHLWLKRSWSLQAAWGTTAAHRRRVADAVLGPAREVSR